MILVSALVLPMIMSVSALSCGWWGDGEDDDGDAIVIGADGRPVSETRPGGDQPGDKAKGNLAPPGVEVPAPRSGYGMVIQPNGHAVPYLDAIGGQPVYSIQQLRQSGFPAVVDLGTSPEVSALHRQETEMLGMKYFNIPIREKNIAKADVLQLNAILAAKENLPILVFSASANQLGEMWALYRLLKGANQDDAVMDGRRFGLTKKSVHLTYE